MTARSLVRRILTFPFRALNWLWQSSWTATFNVVAIAFRVLGWALWIVFWLPVFLIVLTGNGWAMGFCFGYWHEQDKNGKGRR